MVHENVVFVGILHNKIIKKLLFKFLNIVYLLLSTPTVRGAGRPSRWFFLRKLSCSDEYGETRDTQRERYAVSQTNRQNWSQPNKKGNTTLRDIAIRYKKERVHFYTIFCSIANEWVIFTRSSTNLVYR